MGSVCCAASCNRISVISQSGDEAMVLKNVMEKIQLQNSRTIDVGLKKEAEANMKVLKVLLLGASNSGKSTIAKQMRILHTEGFSEAEKLHYKYMVHSNYIDLFPQIAKGIIKFGIQVPPTERELVETFEQAYYGQFLNLDQAEDLLGLIRTFLSFTCVKKAIERIAELDAPDNTEYLLENAHRILKENYSPSHEDIIHARAATKGIHEIIFAFREFKIRLIDVGGQKTERRKWIHCFEGVAAILFVVSLSCYNQVMEEDSQTVMSKLTICF
uniref:G-protein alpha subunit n=1 Tax=Globodera pallida TaxID=36090 RepID=A0A183CF65_GLOPA